MIPTAPVAASDTVEFVHDQFKRHPLLTVKNGVLPCVWPVNVCVVVHSGVGVLIDVGVAVAAVVGVDSVAIGVELFEVALLSSVGSYNKSYNDDGHKQPHGHTSDPTFPE